MIDTVRLREVWIRRMETGEQYANNPDDHFVAGDHILACQQYSKAFSYDTILNMLDEIETLRVKAGVGL